MNQSLKSLLSLSALTFVVACDSRASDDYVGESLLHLEGSVTIAEDDAPSDLVPALAFSTNNGYVFVDTEVRGDFPNSFVLDVLEPPPADAVMTSDDTGEIPAGKPVGVAYITAVRRDHPKRLMFAGFVDTANVADLPGCKNAKPACVHAERWCLDDTEQRCRTVGLPCPDGMDCAPTVSEGDESLIINEDSGMFAGLSENYIVLWTEAGMQKSSLFSQVFAIGEDLQKGYTLLQTTLWPTSSFTTDEPAKTGEKPNDAAAEAQTCIDSFEAKAIAVYNAHHGTHFANIDEIDARYEDADEDTYRKVYDELGVYQLQLALKSGCNVSLFESSRVVHNSSEKLHIRIARDVQPWI